MEKLVTVSELAADLRLNPITIYRWAASGFIPCYRFGRRRMFNRAEVLDWAKARGSVGRKRAANFNQRG